MAPTKITKTINAVTSIFNYVINSLVIITVVYCQKIRLKGKKILLEYWKYGNSSRNLNVFRIQNKINPLFSQHSLQNEISFRIHLLFIDKNFHC